MEIEVSVPKVLEVTRALLAQATNDNVVLQCALEERNMRILELEDKLKRYADNDGDKEEGNAESE